MMIDQACATPIGVFDSGIGGLSVLRHIHQHLPSESLIYVADTGHLPYGPRSSSYVIERARIIARFLVDQGVKAIVVACNTATAAAIVALRDEFSLPVIGVEPGVKPAISQSRSGIVGVLATEGTLGSEKFKRLVVEHGASQQVIVQPCHGWVEQIEQGDLFSDQTRTLVGAAVEPLLRQGADTLVLGCTHYPFLAPIIREVTGPGIVLVDTGQAIALELQRRLQRLSLLGDADNSGTIRFWSSGDPSQMVTQVGRLWPQPLSVDRLPEGFC
mgnify:CR=1 FL=1